MFFEKYKTEEEKLEAVKKNAIAIQYIYNPSEEVQLAAVKKIGDAISISELGNSIADNTDAGLIKMVVI